MRINLSEQTDISDLMGSDLPMPEETIDENGDTSTGGSFKWCDGALLKAIKNGHWVLLDELNLASQSVLEGLNSCLDHRANVYIPELGQTFACPPTFRIFAAQNPLAQGGGRKGLPKSFLNRFTKVYVEALSKDDLQGIVHSKFPILPPDLVESIVHFNDSVQKDIEQRKYGQLGSPWEFNLRDVFRWCDLINNHYKKTGKLEHGAFSDTIYMQRLRSDRDRTLLSTQYKNCFGNLDCIRIDPLVIYEKDHVQVGIASLDSNVNILPPSDSIILGEEPSLLRHLARPMEAVSLCIEMSWPCLLVGAAASGKSTILKSLAESCNRQLEEIALTASSDVNELIGTFEQIDAAEVEARLLNALESICNAACLTLTSDALQLKYLEDISTKYHALMAIIKRLRKNLTAPVVISEKAALKVAEKIVASAKKATVLNDHFRQVCKNDLSMAEGDLQSFKKDTRSKNDNNAVHFRWFDGILIQALERGYWLHLENVNFCPSSVLDRLNPLMETGGELVLTECGIDEDESAGGFGTSRVVKPHPNFRIFLSMNPAFGEVSRAMRNRCVEVSLLPPPVSNAPALPADSGVPNGVSSSSETLDALDSLWGNGVRSSRLAKEMLRSHQLEFNLDDFSGDDAQPCRNLAEWARLLDDSLRRGFFEENDLKSSQQLAYEIHHEEFTDEVKGVKHCSKIEGNSQMVSKVFIRNVLESASVAGNIAPDARLLKSFLEGADSIPLGVSFFGEASLDAARMSEFNKYAPSLMSGDPRLPAIRSHLAANFIRRSDKLDSYLRASFLDGYCAKMARNLKFIAKRQDDTENLSNLVETTHVIDRLAQILDENTTLESLSDYHVDERELSDLSVIEISICVHENKIDRSHISCPVTPVLQPFFVALDMYLNILMDTLTNGSNSAAIMSMRAIFESRDRLWRFLKDSQFIVNSSFLGFDEGGFLVQWTWLKKRFDTLSSNISESLSTSTATAKRNVALIMGTIDRAVQIESGDIRLSSACRKKIGHPLVPAKAQDSTSIRDLQVTAANLSLLNEEDFGYQRLLSGTSATVSMKHLFEAQHTVLVSDSNLIKSETLTALSMAHWATTDEMSATTRMQSKNYDGFEVKNMLTEKLNSLKNNFSTSIRACTVDTSINTIENKLDLDDLKALQEVQRNEESTNDVIHGVLSTFGEIQLTQMAEFICIREEEWIIDNIISVIRMSEDAAMLRKLRHSVAPRIKDFVETVVSKTIWPVCDLRPYQSIIWILESDSVDAQSIRRFFGCCYSTIISTLSRHYWCNSFNDLNSISDEIASPSFWSIKNSEGNYDVAPVHKTDVMAGLAYYSGEPRINHNVVSEFLFRMQGFKRVADTSAQNIPYLTVENQDARTVQARKLFRFLACDLKGLRKNERNSDTIMFLLENMIDALRESFDSDESFAAFRSSLLDGNGDALLSIQSCKHGRFVKLAAKVLPSLLASIEKMDQSSSRFGLALASVYVGILRFHLTLPASPLDPGKKPAAKVAQWNHHLQYLGSKLVTMRMESGLITGNFEPDNDEVTIVMDTLSHGHKKRTNEEKKCVERPADIPPFYDLFKEVHHFASTVASADNILGLLQTIQDDNGAEVESTKKQKEVNWQASTAAFCNQMTIKYSSYEDVTSPFLAALGMIRNGLRCILHHNTTAEVAPNVATMILQDRLMQYPNVKLSRDFHVNDLHEISRAFGAVAEVNQEVFHTKKMEKNGQLSYLLSTLSNLSILKDRHAIDDNKFMEITSYIFRSIADAWNASKSESSTTDEDDETEEERMERQFREQFPDHAKEFNKIVEAIEAVQYGGDVGEDEDISLESKVNDFSISEEQLIFLCDLHEKLFSKKSGTGSDSLRIKSFISTYVAAAQLNNAVALTDSQQPEVKRLGAHCYALALSSRDTPGSSLSFETFMRSDTSIDLDFHKDPNPSELLKADLPLRGLLQRISQLMRAFPGNAILISIGQVAERIRQMDAKTTSLGKVLIGFEIILKKAQEWEQHASQRVALGDSLKKVSHLVAQWRKLELQGWSSLLNVRDQKHTLTAKRNWMRLYNILILNPENSTADDSSGMDKDSTNACYFPKWIWMGQGSKLKNITKDALDASDSRDLFEMVKVLDTFILTSGIGQFNERLRLIDIFSRHLHKEYETATVPDRRKLSKTIILDSFVKHYENLSPMITRAKESLRKPMEKKLKDEVKLSKWDEQSYYALSDSTEKSHRKLMMIVHDYENILHTSVGRILEENFLNGIRPHSEVSAAGPPAQAVTDVPSNSSIFPELQDDISKSAKGSMISTNRALVDNLTNLRKVKRVWTMVDSDFIGDNKYILGIKKYAKKMDKLFSSDLDSHASLGKGIATEICDSMFERINIIREKGTKPMKERALVDLFKLLKKQGYSSMKWCVPRQIREMNSLFHIKSPAESVLNSKNDSVLLGAETYFRRCTVEISRLRSEVQMMGSAYMSKREMDLMVGFSDHGLLMLCQQRANLTKAIQDIKSVSELLHVVDQIKSDSRLPRNQVALLQSIEKFDCQYNVALEAMRQTFVMMKTISSQMDGEKSQCIDMIGIVEGGYSLLSDVYKPCTARNLVTDSNIDSINNAKDHLQTVLDNISTCVDNNREHKALPQDSFNPCLDELQLALGDANTCIMESMKPSQSSESEESVPSKVVEIVKSSLLAAQTLHDGFIKTDDSALETQETDYESLWVNHSQTLQEWDSVNIQKFVKLLQDLLNGLRGISNSDKSYIEGISTDACTLVVKIMDMCQSRLAETLQFYRSVAKFEYIKLRLFRVLIAKGFCSDDVEDGGEADGEGGEGDAKFEDDVEGTGMGEGEGKNDVTDQIENEEQLLGLKGDEENEETQEQRELDEDEAETGMEMENDFDGEMCDVPDKKEDDNDDQDDDDEEELDREMGDGSDPNEQVVDEKMWDEDEDDEEQNDQEEEKFEKDSKVAGETLEDELRTKEDDEEGTGDDGKDDQSPENAGDNQHEDEAEAPKNEDGQDKDQDADADNKEEDMVNNDFEEDYEDKHDGIDIRNEEEEGQEPDDENDDAAMDLDDEMDLNEGDEGDDGEMDGEDAGAQVGEEEEVDDTEDGEDNAGGNDIDENEEGEQEDEDADMESEAIQSAHQTLGDDDQKNADEEKEEEEEKQEEEAEQDNQDLNASDDKHEEAHGVASKSGADTVKRQEEEDENEEDGQGDDEDEEEDEGAGQGDQDDANEGAGQSDANSGEIQDGEQGSGTKPSSTSMDAPNPFRDPGDAEKFWHKKLNVISDAQEEEAEEANSNEKDNPDNDESNPDGDFEFTSNEQDNSTQVLGGVAEEDTTKLNQDDENEGKAKDPDQSETQDEEQNDVEMAKRHSTKQDNSRKKESNDDEDQKGDADVPIDDEDEDNEKEEKDQDVEMSDESDNVDEDEEDVDPDNKIVTDLDQLQVRDTEEHNYQSQDMIEDEEHAGTTFGEMEEARLRWGELQAETNSLSRRLCEKLRLVMEPLVASKLRGDYRTGKRINMKRVIGYIASGYRKDKIWLRRTKPGKRDYRVLLAVDNSESMRNGAGDMALTALTTLANGMSQLDIGELGVASFGEEMKLLHPFHAPFTSSSGVDLVSNFKFNDKRTRTALCVESALAALEAQSNGSSSMQLVFIISDGRIERDSRERLRRIVREMTEKNILLIMVVVEGDEKRGMKPKDSIVNMKEVSFEKGKPKVKHFIDDYPFPYYMVLQDMHTLPEVLGDALKQWFEMMAQNQSQG